MSVKMTIRAATKINTFIDLTFDKIDAALTFEVIARSIKLNTQIPPGWVPQVWNTEIIPEFVNPDGSIFGIFLFLNKYPDDLMDYLYFEEYEGRRKFVKANQHLLMALFMAEPLHQYIERFSIPKILSPSQKSKEPFHFQIFSSQKSPQEWDLETHQHETHRTSSIDLAPNSEREFLVGEKRSYEDKESDEKPHYGDWWSENAMVQRDMSDEEKDINF